MRLLEYIYQLFKPFDLTSFKPQVILAISSLTTVLSSFFEDYFGISGIFAISLLILVIGDHIVGTAVAIKKNKKITSSLGLKTVWKAGAYLFFIYMAFQLQNEVERKQLDAPLSIAIKYFHLYIIIHIFYWELFSIDKHLNDLGFNLGLSMLLRHIKEKLKIK